ncbi:PREDICTED: embryogenesis-associated protein EMB8 [Erythranthe guttata]|uniref:embryogenesis-associated protein EMB8 n=1 Tax=Erythranthe guttata TaxID=4155 RepID=UPI00064D8909|nr:PREDICTED: embryogenesis-associated protein EMB8 [Erythranthe guttata]|eukprot:XP_012842086.1 PREDICTED: embryogenesis-associated protein EMB8 [Erythranthe guttata]
MAKAPSGFAAPFSSIRHLTNFPFSLTSSQTTHFSTLRSTAAAASLLPESSTNPHPTLELIGGAAETFLPALHTIHLPYLPYPLIAWNRHVETIFAYPCWKPPASSPGIECLRTSDGGPSLTGSGDDRHCSDLVSLLLNLNLNLNYIPCQFSHNLEYLIWSMMSLNIEHCRLQPGLTGGSGDTYVRHMLLRARSKQWRVVVFNSRGCGDSPVTTAQFYSASFLGDISEVVEHVGKRYPRSNLYAAGWSLGANILVRYVGQESFSCPLAGAISLCNPFNLIIADEDFRKGFNIIYDKALSNSLCKIFKRHALLFEDIGGEYNIPLAANAKSVREFDDGLTRVSFGFKSVNDYYSNSSSSDSIKNVSIPLLCIQAENDPIAPSRGIPREDIQKNPNCMLIVTPKGGHLGWVAGREAPFGAPWTDPIVMDFLEYLEKPSSSTDLLSSSNDANDLHQLEV